MRFKIGFLDLKKNIITYFLLVIQLSAVMITIILAFSSVRSRVRLYEPFSNYYQNKGLFSIMGFALDEEGRPLNSTSYIKENLVKVESVTGCYACRTAVDNMDFRLMSYDDEIIEKYKPSLKKGKWLSNDSRNIIVSENNYNIDVGDTIFLRGKSGSRIAFTVSGILTNSTPVPGILPADSLKNISYKYFYCNYNVDYEERPLMIVPKNDSEFDYSIINQLLIKFYDDISDEEIKNNISVLSEMGVISSTDLELVKRTSEIIIRNEIRTLFPAIISSATIMIVSILCSTVLSTKRQIRNYSICYICGSRWKTCCYINFLQTIIVSILSLICTFTFILLFRQEKYQNFFYIEIQTSDISAILLTLIVYALLSFCIPLFIIKRTQPISLLKTN